MFVAFQLIISEPTHALSSMNGQTTTSAFHKVV